MRLRRLSRLTIAGCTTGLALMLAGSLYLTQAFQKHMASVERLDRLQYAIAKLGVNVGKIDRAQGAPADLSAIHDNLRTLREALEGINHPDTQAALAHVTEIEAILDTFDSDTIPVTADRDESIHRKIQDLYATEARLTLTESGILQDEHRELDRHLMATVAAFGALALVFGLLCILGFGIVNRRIRGPVQTLTAAALKAERGDLGQRLPITSNDEFGSLTRAFNAMLSQMRDNNAEVATHQAELARTLSERTTVLNALPAHIALLDSDGVIRDVNERWRHFGQLNDYADPDFGLGRNYLAICEQAKGDCSDEARQVAAGIRGVLAGETSEFALEYPCHSPDQKRWFRVMATRVAPTPETGARQGAVVTHIDITERRIAEEHLREQAYLLQTAGRMARFGGWSIDLADGTVSLSEQITAIVDMPGDFTPTVDEAIDEFYAAGSRERIRAYWDACLANGTPWDDEFELITGRGRHVWGRSAGEPVRADQGRITHVRGVLQEVTEYKHIEQQLRRLAYEDPLTGLLSRQGFNTRLAERLAKASVPSTGYLVVIDLQRLNDINQAFGYEYGNQLLVAVAQRFTQALAPGELAGRLGGDQFGFLRLDSGQTGGDTDDLAAWLDAIFARPFDVDGVEITVQGTYGIARVAASDTEADEIMRRGQLAFHVAREQEGRHWVVYGRELDEAAQERIRITHDLRHAIKRNEFELHYQPKVRLRDGQVVSAEALLRWRHPTRGMQRPDLFIPAAEHSKAILAIGEWVIREACLRLRQWQRDRLSAARVAVNVSMIQLTESDLAATVARILRETGVDPSGLSLEITESVLAHEPTVAGAQLKRLHEMGVRLSLDDFGTGYASLGHLNLYPFDEIKIDRVFVEHAATRPYSREIVHMVIRMAAILGCDVVAEGIETRRQRDLLVRLGCDIGQGYHFSMPLHADDLNWLLTHHAPLPLDPDAGTRPADT